MSTKPTATGSSSSSNPPFDPEAFAAAYRARTAQNQAGAGTPIRILSLSGPLASMARIPVDPLSLVSSDGLPEDSPFKFKPLQQRTEDYGQSLLAQAKKIDEAVARYLDLGMQKFRAQVHTEKAKEGKVATDADTREYINQLVTDGTESRQSTRFDATGIKIILQTGGASAEQIAAFADRLARLPLIVEKTDEKAPAATDKA
jgi:hypothetical protein